MAEEFVCKFAPGKKIIPNVYNRNATCQKDCVFAYNTVKQNICEQCIQYINSTKTK